MMTSDQAKAIIDSKTKLDFEHESFSSFSFPYQMLGKLITRNLYQQGSGYIDVLDTYQNAFGEDVTINPWSSKEGAKLAQKLFGSLWANYIAKVWDLIFTLPYQTDYYRRSYRMPANKRPTYFVIFLSKKAWV